MAWGSCVCKLRRGRSDERHANDRPVGGELMFRVMAQVYSEHGDFDAAWKVNA